MVSLLSWPKSTCSALLALLFIVTDVLPHIAEPYYARKLKCAAM